MNSTLTTVLSGSASIMALMVSLATPASAQTAPESTPAPVATPAPAVPQQPVASDPAETRDIIVTGSRIQSSGYTAPTPTTVISQADARVGRPMTPVSYAGVARRTTRRAVVGGAAVGGAYVAAPGVGCYQVVDAYGRMIWRCP